MKHIIIKAFSILFLCGFFHVFAQKNTQKANKVWYIPQPEPSHLNSWSILFHSGISKFYGDLQTGDFLQKGPQEVRTFATGIAIRKQISHLFGTSFDITSGLLSGSNKDYNAYFSMNNPFYQSTLAFDINAKSLVLGRSIMPRFKWNLHAGIGYLWFSTNVYGLYDQTLNISYQDVNGNTYQSQVLVQANKLRRFSNSSLSSTTAGLWEGSGSAFTRELVIPTGIQFSYELSPRLDISFDYTVNNVFSEKLDMTVGSDNPVDNIIPSRFTTFAKGEGSVADKWGYLNIGLTVKLGKILKQLKGKPEKDSNYHLSWVSEQDIAPTTYNPTIIDVDSVMKANMPQPADARLYMDSDADGVADLFDKEPNTATNTMVSGAGITFDIASELNKFVGNDTNKIKLPCTELFGNILFKTDKNTLTTESLVQLASLATYLNHTDCRVVLVGHTDSRMGDTYNLKLSQKRASAVQKALIKAGLNNPSRILIEYYGEFKPLDPRKLSKNRRVEIKILPQNTWNTP